VPQWQLGTPPASPARTHPWPLTTRCKQSNFETTTRAPLLLHVPWMPGTFGQRTNALVELIDVMPTVLELMGLTETVRDRAQRARS
jgi:arylsulfatase A-like enzyme